MDRKNIKTNMLDNFKTSFKVSIKNSKVIWLILFSFILSIPMFAFVTMFSQPYLISRGFEITSLGIIFGIITGLSGLFASLSYKVEKKLGEKISFLLIVLSFTGLLTLAGMLFIKGVLFVIIALYAVKNYKDVIIDNYINHQIDSSSRATVLSIQSFINNIGVTTLIVMIGHLADLYSIDTVLIFMGLFVGLFSIPFLIWRNLDPSSSRNILEKGKGMDNDNIIG